MVWQTIEKPQGNWVVVPNLVDYEQTRAAFSWEAAQRTLDGLPGGRGLNLAHAAVDRHAAGARRGHLALRWLGKRGEVRDFTYGELSALTNRFANVLRRFNVGKGDRVFLLAGRIPELYISALGTLKNGSVFCPLFSAFGPEPIRQRLSIGDGKVLVTTAVLYKRKIADLRASLPQLQHVLLIGTAEEIGAIPGTHDFYRLLAEADERFEIPPTDPEDLALLHFTSGTTGKPKGAVHVHQAVVAHHITGTFALDFHPDDIFWCTADPGWVTGTSYGIIAPLTHGITSIIDEADFDAERWYGILQEQKITVWYTAPTAVRMMMKVGAEVVRKYDLRYLRFIASVGEPLNPEAVVWGQEAFGLPIHDNWWQTETGGIMIANYAAMDIRPGSMGRPLPGIEAGIVHRQPDGAVEVINEPGVEGELALRPGWPSMFRGYLHEEERYRKCFAGGWYLTGDLAKRDADNYFWFVGRADDVIKSSGHLIGLFEVESALMEHPAVAEGEFHECMNLAALWKLPVLFCCENNLYAMGTALKRSESEIDLCLKATSYEVPAWLVDGMDVVAVEEAAQRAAAAVRAGGGPYFLEFRTYRFRAHSMFDPQLYRDKQEVEDWKTRDPLNTFQARLHEQSLLEDADLARLEEEAAAEVTRAVEFAEAGAWEPVEDLTKYVYSEGARS